MSLANYIPKYVCNAVATLLRGEHESDIRSETSFRFGYLYPKIPIFDIRIRFENFWISNIRISENLGLDSSDIQYPTLFNGNFFKKGKLIYTLN